MIRKEDEGVMRPVMIPHRDSARARLALIAALTCCLAACQGGSERAPLPAEAQASAAAAPEATTPEAPAAKAAPAAVAAPPQAGPRFVALDLLHNRPTSHRIAHVKGQPVLVIDAGAVDFLRYINGNYPEDWALNLSLEGATGAALRNGRTAKLWTPALRPQGAQALQARVFNPSKNPNMLKLQVNGKALEVARLAPGWQSVTLKVPEGALRAENTIDFEFSDMGRVEGKLSGGGLAWLRLGAAEALAVAEGEAGPVTVALPGAPLAQDALVLDAGEGAAWFMWALPKGALELEVKAPAGCGVSVEAFTQEGGAAPASALRQASSGGDATLRVDLDPVAGEGGQVARVEVIAAQDCGAPVRVERAQLTVPGERPTRAQVKPPKRILFWMIDTLRADYLPFYNPETNVETPALAKLASEGALFKLAFVQGNESKVSHASLFSGMYPSRHGVAEKGTLKPEMTIMPEAIKAAGYRTGAHISNGYISQPWGFVQGWDHFVNNLRDGWRIDGAAMAGHALDWAKKSKDSDFFLYVGTIDPHVTYRRHDDIIGRYDTKPYSGRYDKYCSGEDLGKIKGGSLKVNERDKERIINLYKNEITFNDQAFATLRQGLEAEGLWEDTMVIITSDHGDEFWEHGSVGHGHNIHQELVHVPLLISYPPLIKANTVVDAGVDVLDVYPTIMDIIGKPRPDDLQGKSLLPLMLGQHGGYPEPAIATRYLGHYTMQAQHWKLYLRKGEYTLHDRRTDPLELSGAEVQNPLATRWLLDAMSTFRANRKQWDKTTWGVPTNLSGEFAKLSAGKK